MNDGVVRGVRSRGHRVVTSGVRGLQAPARRRIAPLAAVSFLAACGGGPSGSNSSPAENSSPPILGTTNTPPQISGSPAMVAPLGQSYSFQPAAQDADGDPLSFGIQNKPAWAAFDFSKGTLYGTPACTDSGTSSNVVISVTDGRSTAALPAFSIVVGTPSVNVSWVPPTTNTDGTPVTGLDGFGVYYGTASGQYSQFVAVPDPHKTSICLSGLSTGLVWYFAVTAISRSGVESAYSIEASKVLR